MRLTRKAAIFGLLAALLVVAGSTGQAGWLFVIASGLIGVLGFALFERHRLGDLVIERSVPRRVRVGDGTPVSIAIENPGRRESPPLRLVDRFEPFGTHIYATEPIPPGTSVLIAPELTAESRGVYESGPIEITTGAPFGLKRSKRTIDVPSQTTVVPRWVELRSFPLLEPSSFPRERLHERARIGHSDEIFGTREYRHGDPFRAIHWKSSAHAGHPIVREYQQRSAGRIAIAVWGGEVGEAPDSDLEMLVSSAASIGRYAVSTGHRVAIFHCPSGEFRIARALTHDAILDELARVRPSADGTKELFEAVTKGAGRGGTVLVHVSTAAAKDLGLRSTINGIGSAGNRVILVTARSSTWDPSVVEASMEDLRGACRDVRVLKRHQELRSCLEIY
ncbi:MAG: DUF58 domain-containing protein [Actinomycetota bacterium]